MEATIASEGSGFYLSKNMDDTIIIVLAQSGTTIDTNVYAKMARKRGAYTLSIVNKKFGDVTYIVQKICIWEMEEMLNYLFHQPKHILVI